MGKYIKKFDTHSDYEDFIETEDFIKPNVSYCIDNVEVHYNPAPPMIDGHEYVDLGLPSGTLWAAMNVGATNPEEYGLYFQWGDIQGYTASQVGRGERKKAFGWGDYKWSKNGGSTMSKYNSTDGKMVLNIEDDAVAANWGGSWKMPTDTQFQELINNTNNEWTTVNNVNGYKFTSKTDSSKYIFIPAAGSANNGGLGNVGSIGSVWSSSLEISYDESAYCSHFNSSNVNVLNNDRFRGQSVRGVVG